METPEAELKVALHTAHDANKRLAAAHEEMKVQRDAAERRYVKQREENSDLEDQLITGQRQSAVATGKYYAALAQLQRRTVVELLVSAFFLAAFVALRLWLK